MEKLMYSTTPFPCKLRQPSHSLLPTRIRHVDFKLPSRRVNSLSFKCLSDSSSSSSKTQNGCEKNPFAFPGLTYGSGSDKTHFLKQIAEKISHQNKVLSASTIVLLSAVFLMLIHPVIVSPAFASFANAGGPAAAALGSRFVRNELLSSAWTGFFAGCLHTLSGPDHLAALAPLSIGRTRMESAAVGALWGCGHDAGQLIFGLLFLLLKDRLHIEVIRTWGTRVVGFTLLVIGAMGIKEASEVHSAFALENGEGIDIPVIGKKKKVGFATFATGIVHGLQPDALLIILPALALPSRLAGAAFLGMFLVGTVMAMGSYTVFIGSCSQALKDRIPRITEKLTWASSLIAIGLGLAIIISQFLGFSLY
ncbi:chloroplast protein FOR GROWTH AND FERTILITY 2-like [Lycium barbarum]|uniref:chloroplast protein FOR GROWTH AND FERTILITY 2-like n=1 Tax=Lycium barbarum TaxID=112863 RepID=UPI00293EB12E|nr:chloroplast protein FOR GROWTH AND FERTILITY 2-like [Lycium barbarum]